MAKFPKETGDASVAVDPPAAGEPPVVTADVALVAVGDAPAPVVAGLGEAAAALGAPVVPVPVGGPGVGAAQIAAPAAGVVTTELPDGRHSDTLAGYVNDLVASGRIGPDRREALLRLGATADGLSDLRSLYGDATPLARTSLGSTIVDPDDVARMHVFKALVTIVHDGRTVRPGESVTLDYRDYAELVSIGAVPAIDWETGRPLRV